MRAKIILLLVISLLIIGCVETPKSITNLGQDSNSKNIIPETYEDITNKLLKECGKTLTTAQCDDWVENHINGNYVRWDGEVVDVRDGVVYVTVEKAIVPGNVALHDVSKDKLMELKPKENIRFTGKINIEKGRTSLKSYWATWSQSMGMVGGINLYNAEIELG